MLYVAVIALKAKDPRDKDKKSRGTWLRAGKVIPFDLDADQATKWLKLGYIREAEVADLAEAVHAGELSADVLDYLDGEKKPVRKTKEKSTKTTSQEQAKSDEKPAGAGEDSGDDTEKDDEDLT